MIDFIYSFIRSSLDLFLSDIFVYLFSAFIGLFSIRFINVLIWGK